MLQGCTSLVDRDALGLRGFKDASDGIIQKGVELGVGLLRRQSLK
jgi:hypothetical protein